MRTTPSNRTITFMLLLMSAILVATLFTPNITMKAYAADSSSAPQANTWSYAAPKPTNCWQPATATVNGKIYALSGIADSPNGPVLLNTTEEFDPATNTWATKTAMPFPTAPASRFPFGVAACNGKIYAFGVINYSLPITMSVLVYDPQTDSWETKQPMPINATAETTAIANAIGTEIYVMGNSANGTFNIAYTPATDTWATKLASQSIDLGKAFTVLDGKIYVVGGAVNGNANQTLTQVYDPAADAWSTVAPVPSLAGYAAAASTTGTQAPKRMYLFGSFQGVYTGSFVYDPSTDSWQAFAAMPEAVENFALATVNDQIYVIGGYIAPLIAGYLNQTLVYTPFGYGGAPMPTPEPSFTLPPPPSASPSTSPEPTKAPTVQWSKTYNSGTHQGLIQTGDGGYLLVGESLLKTDAQGNQLWNTILTGNISISAAVQASDGGYAVAGLAIIDSSTPHAFGLTKTDASGNVTWSKTYPGMYQTVGEDNHFVNLFAAGDGGYVLAGTVSAYTGAHQPSFPWLLKVDSNGNVVWSRTYESGNMLAAVQNVYGGYTFIDSSLLMQVDADRNMQWNRTIEEFNQYTSAFISANRGFAYATTVNDSFLLARIDGLGTQQWSRAYVAPGNDSAFWSLAATGDGGSILAGSTNLNSSAANGEGSHLWLLKTGADGNPIWSQTYGEPINPNVHGSIIQTRDGGFAVMGETNPNVNGNLRHQTCLVKLAYSNWPSATPVTSTFPASNLIWVLVAVLVILVVAVVGAAVVLRKRANA